MKLASMLNVLIILCVMIFATRLNADETLRSFTQPTIDGKTIKSETLKGMPVVINFLAPE